jgi:cell fate regulator YaaT (PSP1 superfamily)
MPDTFVGWCEMKMLSEIPLGVLEEDIFATPGAAGRRSGCGSCGTGGSDERCGNGLEKIYPTTAVRFGFMRYIGEFSHAADMRFTCGAKVVIQTRRGIELGEQVSLSCNGCSKSVTRDQMRSWVNTCGDDAFIFDAGRILREATAADLAECSHIQNSALAQRKLAQLFAERLALPMRVVECESLFGGERIIFYFTADQRVDFRTMVRELATEFRTRIEMRQIGARDEARLLADYETCGREVCCKVFLKTLRPISMKMAKLQKATLDPLKVSGRCGRLKCCLRYEHAGYEELEARLPRVGVDVRTHHGDGTVVNRQILTQLVQIMGGDNVLQTVVIEDIYEIGGRMVPGARLPEPKEPKVVAERRPSPPRDGAPPDAPPRRRAAPRPPRGQEGAPAKEPGSAADRPSATPGRRRRTRPPMSTDAPRSDAPSTDEPRAGETGAGRRPGRRRGRRRRPDRGGGPGPPAGGAPPPE